VTIRLQAHPRCVGGEACDAFARPLLEQLSGGPYGFPASLLALADIHVYLAEHRTARKRAMRAMRLGYEARPISRADHLDDIHAINTSMPERQGRPMSPSYRERPTLTPLPAYDCPRHRIDEHGVFAADGRLVAYLVMYVCGDLALVSQILGHADHLASDVMYLLAVEAFRATLDRSGPVTVFYNRWDSGQDGLRYFKARLGFQPGRAEWAA